MTHFYRINLEWFNEIKKEWDSQSFDGYSDFDTARKHGKSFVKNIIENQDFLERTGIKDITMRIEKIVGLQSFDCISETTFIDSKDTYITRKAQLYWN